VKTSQEGTRVKSGINDSKSIHINAFSKFLWLSQITICREIKGGEASTIDVKRARPIIPNGHPNNKQVLKTINKVGINDTAYTLKRIL